MKAAIIADIHGNDYIVRILSGQVRASWMNHWDEKAHYPAIVDGL